MYAGGQFPLNPFYWGLYGGSEGSGVLAEHAEFCRALAAMGYEPFSTTVFLQYDLARKESRNARAVLIRRQTQLEIEEDALPIHWWENQSLSEFDLTRFRLLARSGDIELARATTWDMNLFGRGDGRARGPDRRRGVAVPPPQGLWPLPDLRAAQVGAPSMTTPWSRCRPRRPTNPHWPCTKQSVSCPLTAQPCIVCPPLCLNGRRPPEQSLATDKGFLEGLGLHGGIILVSTFWLLATRGHTVVALRGMRSPSIPRAPQTEQIAD